MTSFHGGEKWLPKIKVRYPVTIVTLDGDKFVTYEIRMKDVRHIAYRLRSSSVRRRYSEFVWLREQLQRHNRGRKLPRLPSKTIFTHFDGEFLAQRCKGLRDFMNELQKLPYCLSDSAFHLFTQTDLRCEQIEEYVGGKMAEDLIAQLWEARGVQGNIFSDSSEAGTPEEDETHFNDRTHWLDIATVSVHTPTHATPPSTSFTRRRVREIQWTTKDDE